MTLAELRSWVRRQTVMDSNQVSDNDLNTILGQALLDVAVRYEWPWCYAADTISLADGTATYNLPSDAMWVKALIHDGEGIQQLDRTSVEAVKAEYGDAPGDADLPRYFYQSGLQVTFVPTPDATKTVNVHYYATPDLNDFDADSDEPPFHAAFHLALAEYATALIWEEQEVEEKAAIYWGRYLDTVARMAGFYAVRLPEQSFVVGGGRMQLRLPFSSYLDA